MLAARLVDRTGKGIRSGPRDAMIAESVPPTQRGRAFGLNRSMDHFGAAVGPLLASLLLFAGTPLRIVFLIAAAIGIMAPVVLFFRLREQPADVADRSGPIGRPGARLVAARLLLLPRRLRHCSRSAIRRTRSS